jgi:methylglyoxal/glyoxal reductase
MTPHPTITLNNGVRIPQLGLGVYQVEGTAALNAVSWALEAGYRHIDTASLYGNEKEVGEAIRASGIPREEIFVTTKLWITNFLRAEAAFNDSLKRLGMEYVDLYLIHWPSPMGRDHAWKSLEQLHASGLTRAIGVSNYAIKHLEALQKISETVPAVNQVEFSPFLYQKELRDYCTARNIQLEAYSPLTRGKKLHDDTVETIAKKYSKSSAQIMIRWSIQHGNIVIPKSIHQERIRENANVFDFEITDVDMKILDALPVPASIAGTGVGECCGRATPVRALRGSMKTNEALYRKALLCYGTLARKAGGAIPRTLFIKERGAQLFHREVFQ